MESKADFTLHPDVEGTPLISSLSVMDADGWFVSNSEEEWEIMRQHPTSVYEMLSPIHYLRPALDIP